MSGLQEAIARERRIALERLFQFGYVPGDPASLLHAWNQMAAQDRRQPEEAPRRRAMTHETPSASTGGE